MKFIRTFEDTVCAQTRDEGGNVLYQRIRRKGSVIACEDDFAKDMVKFKKGAFHQGPTVDIWEAHESGGQLGRAARPEEGDAPERQDLGSKLARAEKAVPAAQAQAQAQARARGAI